MSGATFFVLLAGALAAASADTPQGWRAAHVSAFDFVVVLLLLPLAAAAVIAFLAYLPALTTDRGYEPGRSWRGEVEWFGGPTAGLEAAHEVTAEQLESGSSSTGGTSGRW